MGNRSHPSSCRGQLMSPGLPHSLQLGQSLVLVLCLEKNGNSIDVMGHGKLKN